MTRTNKGIQLTPSGETLLSYSQQMLQLNNTTLQALQKTNLTGTLRFGIPTDYAQSFLHSVIPSLQRDFPSVEAHVQCQRSRVLRQKVARGDLDIAIVAAESNSHDEICLWSERLVWSAPLNFSLQHQGLLPVALFDDDCVIRDYSLADLKHSQVNYQTLLSSPLLDNIASAVHTGFAISLLPESLTDSRKSKMIQPSLLASNKVLKMNMIYKPGLEENKLERIYECLMNTFAKPA